MGTYRLFLAFSVLYSHAFGMIFGRSPGVIAVISFFIMSGYLNGLVALVASALSADPYCGDVVVFPPSGAIACAAFIGMALA